MKSLHIKTSLFSLCLIAEVLSLTVTTSANATTFGCKYKNGSFVSWGTGNSQEDAAAETKMNCAAVVTGSYYTSVCTSGNTTCEKILPTNDPRAYASRYDKQDVWFSIAYGTNCYEANNRAQLKCLANYPTYQKTVCMEGEFSCHQTGDQN